VESGRALGESARVHAALVWWSREERLEKNELESSEVGVRAETPRVAEPGPSESPRGWQVARSVSRSPFGHPGSEQIIKAHEPGSSFLSGVLHESLWRLVHK